LRRLGAIRVDHRVVGLAFFVLALRPGLVTLGYPARGAGPPTCVKIVEKTMEFQGTDQYVVTEDLKMAVNAAINLKRPLLIKGEPGTGKTMLAEEVAEAINAPLITWHIKSSTKAQQGLYEYDAVSRLRDSQLGNEGVEDVSNYIKKGKLWEAFEAEHQTVLLIDEIDKADIEFPNDLLQELDRMEFFVYETGETIRAKQRPIVIITSNNEKELPDAFLRRCFFHYINFPDADTMMEILDVHFPDLKKDMVKEALEIFFDLRKVPGLKKKPSTSELIDWLKLLMADDIPDDILTNRDPSKAIPPLYGALVKNESDVQLLERLAFMARREGR
jgi:MoxR-like ATPase